MLSALGSEPLLWAWLIVNTRTVSLPLSLPEPSDLNNHTLVPLLDLVNHTSDRSLAVPRPQQITTPGAMPRRRCAAGPKWHLIPGRIGFQLVAPERGMKKGEEVLFEYGSHSSAALFTDYGFVEEPKGWEVRDAVDPGWLASQHGDVDLGHIVHVLWESDQGHDRKIEVLKTLGCFGSVSAGSHRLARLTTAPVKTSSTLIQPRHRPIPCS